MTAKVGRVDHPVVAVYDIQKTRAQYQKLGFIVPPSGQHQEWGTENLCIMFPNDYLEIRGIGDPNKFLAGVDKFLEKGEGFYSVAFNAISAEESYQEAIATGIKIEKPKHLNRKLVLEDKILDLHFKTVMLGHENFPGLTHANLCEHMSADILRQEEWLDHPNGVIEFGRLIGVVNDFDAAEKAYVNLLGKSNVHREKSTIILNFGEGADIELIDQKEATYRGIENGNRGDQYLAAATLIVKDIKTTRNILSTNGIRFDDIDENKVKLHPDDACGANIYFQEK